MKALSNSRDCPSCGGDHKSKPFCEYENGVHCFSCGYTKSYNYDYVLKSDSRNLEIQAEDGDHSILCSGDYSVFSLTAKKWLMQYFIDDRLVRKHNIQYVDESLIFRMSEHSYQRRWLDKRMFITKGEKIPLWFMSNDSSTVIIVEDYISAIRLAEQFNVVCLLGTKCHKDVINQIVANYSTIILWLDNDIEKEINSGQIAAAALKSTVKYAIRDRQNKYGYTLSNQQIFNIASEKDPKWYSDNELKNMVDDAIINL